MNVILIYYLLIYYQFLHYPVFLHLVKTREYILLFVWVFVT
jgi:hypothetical protein